MARNLLTDVQLRKIKPGTARLNDGDGLYLRCFVKGKDTHAWRFNYTRPNGKRNELSLGKWPDTPLKLAREKAQEARERLAAGQDPGEERKEAVQAAQDERATVKALAEGKALPGTVRAVWEQFAPIHAARVSPGHANRCQKYMESEVFPTLGDRPIRDVTEDDMLKVLTRIEKRGAVNTAVKVNLAASVLWKWAKSRKLVTHNIANDLNGALARKPVRNFPALTEPKDFARLLLDIDGYVGTYSCRAALQLSPMVLLRPNELLAWQWDWVDLDAALVAIPAERMKQRVTGKLNGVGHFVPLATQAVAILREQHKLYGKHRYVFPQLLKTRPLHVSAVNQALTRLGYKGVQTAHGFRASARTMIRERLRVSADVIECQLAHKKPGLGTAYDRSEFIEERTAMMQAWADYMDQLKRTHAAVPFEQRRAA